MQPSGAVVAMVAGGWHKVSERIYGKGKRGGDPMFVAWGDVVLYVLVGVIFFYIVRTVRAMRRKMKCGKPF